MNINKLAQHAGRLAALTVTGYGLTFAINGLQEVSGANHARQAEKLAQAEIYWRTHEKHALDQALAYSTVEDEMHHVDAQTLCGMEREELFQKGMFFKVAADNYGINAKGVRQVLQEGWSLRQFQYRASVIGGGVDLNELEERLRDKTAALKNELYRCRQ